MAKVLHIDPFGGVAGDMLLGALLDLGVDLEALRGVLAGLHLPGWRLTATRDRHQGFAGTRVVVDVDSESHPARHLSDVERLLADATLPDRVRERALTAFRRLFAAEAEVHGTSVEETHLHELAAVDAVVDIVGTCAALELLGIERASCGPVPVGSGTVKTAHGTLPVPPPAVAWLLRGVPLANYAADGEMTTPTGATLVTTLAHEFSPLPGGTVIRVGVGLGTRQFAGLPNVLRAFLVESARAAAPGRPMLLVETTLDDVTGETLGALLEGLRTAGAVDAWCLPGTGRKGRPVVELRALVERSRCGEVTAALFAEGATLGLRLVECTRPELERHVVSVATGYGEIPVKVGVFEGRVVSAKPEHDACREAAARAGVSLAAVADAARRGAPRLGSPWST
ncbi:MAG: nickel pincer cofactor biosynthesis protein LarC [Thermoanaerobaculales bacterium]